VLATRNIHFAQPSSASSYHQVMAAKAPVSAAADVNDLNTPLKSVLNFRDVGAFVNRASGTT
jgi:hypothetical protein